MEIRITLHCPKCQSKDIVKNGTKANSVQNFLCKTCKRQFIHDSDRIYKGSTSNIDAKIRLMLVRNCGIRDISVIENISCQKVLSVLVNHSLDITPKYKHYNSLEIDEHWSYIQNKKKKLWLIYACDKETGEIVAYVFGKRDLKTAKRLRNKINQLGVTYDAIYSDDWSSFIKAFKGVKHIIGKDGTTMIEGTNCTLRTRIRRAVRRTCCFSKKRSNHIKAFILAMFYINNNFI